MKRTTAFFCLLLAVLLFCSCGSESPAASESTAPSEAISEEESVQTSEPSEESEPVSEETAKEPIPDGAKVVTNLDYTNTGKMGDNDGPAYCVYSKVGHNKASMDIAVSKIRINTVRKDGKFVNAYLFLGCDVYEGVSWCNCFDAGLCYSGRTPAWHLFYNIYEPAEEGEKKWFESNVKLDAAHDYRLILDTSEESQRATIVIWDITEDKKADEATFSVKKMQKSGANTAYLMDFALDFPADIRKDRSGNSTDDWGEITLFNTDEGLYMQNILVSNVKIGASGKEYEWDETRSSHRSLWPDKTVSVVDYACTKVIGEAYDHDFRVDLDMNR